MPLVVLRAVREASAGRDDQGALETGILMKPTVPEIAPMVRALYARHSAGCCLHIVLDDGNVGDDCVKSCIREAIERGHADCMKLSIILLVMSRTQRLKLQAYAYPTEGL